MAVKLNGRPRKPINWEEFEKLCALQCTQEEMASFFNVHADTLSDRAKEYYGEAYSIIYKQFAEAGKCSLRRNQFVLCKKNATMCIWLGKQWLGQKDISKDEVRDIAGDLINAVTEIQSESRRNEISGSELAPQQLVLDKRCIR